MSRQAGSFVSGDFKAAPDIRIKRAGSRWRVCTAATAKGQGSGDGCGQVQPPDCLV